MKHRYKLLLDERAGAMVENVIILPLIFIVIYSLILTAFVVHDRSTIDAAAKRGAIYASHCVIDPSYASITGQSGELDIASNKSFSFSNVGKKINAYRYINGGENVASYVSNEVTKIVEKTRIKWRPMNTVQVSCNQKNMFIYQDIVVSVSADYSIPKFFAAFGMETEYNYTATATIAATDPDEFVRNADLVVDMVTKVDNMTGNKIEKVLDKISTLGDKVLEWLDVGK